MISPHPHTHVFFPWLPHPTSIFVSGPGELLHRRITWCTKGKKKKCNYNSLTTREKYKWSLQNGRQSIQRERSLWVGVRNDRLAFSVHYNTPPHTYIHTSLCFSPWFKVTSGLKKIRGEHFCLILLITFVDVDRIQCVSFVFLHNHYSFVKLQF